MAKISKEDLTEILPVPVRKEWAGMWETDAAPAAVRQELTGMLPAVIARVEALLAEVRHLNPVVVRGYDSTAGEDSFYSWGAAVRIKCDDTKGLHAAAKRLGFLSLSDDGDLAYVKKLTLKEFKTYRVGGDLELAPEKEA